MRRKAMGWMEDICKECSPVIEPQGTHNLQTHDPGIAVEGEEYEKPSSTIPRRSATDKLSPVTQPWKLIFLTP
jgi:hypothetical protein